MTLGWGKDVHFPDEEQNLNTLAVRVDTVAWFQTKTVIG